MTETTTRISFGPQLCGTLAESADREWLVPDGLGGFAMGTVSGLRTRRYHGLLVVATEPPSGRRLGLVSLDPVLVLPSGARVPLGVHEWSSGDVSPRGYELMESFVLSDGLPRWRWRVGDIVLERTLATQHGSPSLAVVHRLVAGGPVRLELAALTTWRDVHGERHASGELATEQVAGGVVVDGGFRLRGPGWEPGGAWYTGVHARLEAERGLAADEDVWFAGRFVADLTVGATAEVSAWAGDLSVEPPPAAELVAAARRRAGAVMAQGRAADPVDAALLLAADAFVVSGPDVVAGYPWFGAWSRDTMTSYEGLFLATGRADEGRQLLRRYAATLSEGMLANTADTGSTEYNTADGTLWFLHAVGRHLEVTGDGDLAAELAPALGGVVQAHLRGTRYGIGIDPSDGLLQQGEPGYALTWMDARVDGVGVTPRVGKAVELNALWARGLAVVSRLPGTGGVQGIDKLWVQARESFARRFPAPQGWLYDVVDGPDGDDASLRPNQLLAFALPDAPLAADTAGAGEAIRAVGAALFTPLGPRSLAAGSPGYRGTHRGSSAERDRAYHQGTVWPWLVGPYVEASRRAGLDASTALDGLTAHLGEWGLGSVSETAEADAPHRATGCPFQAWSVAELLRARRLFVATR